MQRILLHRHGLVRLETGRIPLLRQPLHLRRQGDAAPPHPVPLPAQEPLVDRFGRDEVEVGDAVGDLAAELRFDQAHGARGLVVLERAAGAYAAAALLGRHFERPLAVGREAPADRGVADAQVGADAQMGGFERRPDIMEGGVVGDIA